MIIGIKDVELYNTLKETYVQDRYIMLGRQFTRDITPALKVGMIGTQLPSPFDGNITGQTIKSERVQSVENFRDAPAIVIEILGDK